MSATSPALEPLASLLRKRLEIIANHEHRQRDPEGHLASLAEVSQAIEAEHLRMKADLPARLRHYMQQSSYQKALAYMEGTDE